MTILQDALASPIASPLGLPASNPYAAIDLSLGFVSGKPNVLAGASYAAFSSVPGVTYTPGTLSGAGATVSTALNASGVLVGFASGASRITDAGLTVEPAATNLLTNSNALTNNTFYTSFNSTRTAAGGAVVDPMGGSAATIHTSTGAFPTMNSNSSFTVLPNTIYSFGRMFHAGTVNAATLKANGTSGDFANATAVFNWNGSSWTAAPAGGFLFTAVTASVVNLGNGWAIGWVTFTTNGATTGIQDQSWVGDSTAAPTSGFIYVYGGMLVAGGPTSYIPTAAAAVTRSADVFTATFTATSGHFATVIFGTNANAYVANTSPINLVSSTTAWNGQPIQQVLVQATQPIPAPAVGAGYLKNTFSNVKNFTTATVDMGLTHAPGFQFYFYNFGGSTPTSANVTLNGDGSATIGAGGNVYNANLSTLTGLGGQAFRGTGFGGGFYAEALCSFTATNADFSLGFPAWWAESVQKQLATSGLLWQGAIQGSQPGYQFFAEPDFMENFLGNNGEPSNSHENSLLSWYGATGSTTYTPIANQATVVASNAVYAEPGNYFGFLWIPATNTTPGFAGYYFNGALTFAVSWPQLSLSNQPPPAPSWVSSIMDGNVGFPAQYMLLLGSNNTQPIRCHSVNVWQLSAAGNVVN